MDRGRPGVDLVSPNRRNTHRGASALDGSLRRRVRLAWMVIAVERAARAFWPFHVGVAFALALGLAGVLPALPAPVHAGVLALVCAGLAGLLIRSIRAFRLPDREDATRRLDADAPLRPAATLEDRPAIGRGDPVSERLWELHLLRVSRAAESLRVSAPDLRLSHLDPWALRFAAPLLLFAATVLAWGSWGPRIADALQPRWDAALLAGAVPVNLEAWAEPPAYTGAAPVYLPGSDVGLDPIALPEGTRLQAWVHDTSAAPVLAILDGGDDAEAVPGEVRSPAAFEEAGGDSWRLVDWVIPEGRYRVAAEGDVLAEWDFRIVPDEVPSIDFRAPPQATRTGAITFSYGMADDYGAARGWAELRIPETTGGESLVERKPLEIPLALPPVAQIRSQEGGEEFVIRDLLSHPWAGAEVELSLFVEDDSRQVASAGPVVFRLPEHAFKDPMAKAFAEQRRGLAESDDLGDIDYVRTVIDAAIRHPSHYFEDPVPFLAARISNVRLDAMLGRGVTEDGLSEVSALLWRAARRLDEGVLPDALEALREQLQAMEEALRQGAELAEMEQKLADLREAIGSYLAALAASQQDSGDPAQSLDPRLQRLTSEALDDVLRSIGDAAQLGAEELARRQLAQLRALLENLQAGPGGALDQGISDLGEIIRDQTALSDRTMRLGQESGSGGGGTERMPEGKGMSVTDGSALASEQGELQMRLDAIREGLARQQGDNAGEGRVVGRLDDALDAMGEAAGALGEGDAPGALAAQREALESLQGAAMELLGMAEGEAVGVLPDDGSGQGGRLPGLPGLTNPFGDIGLPDQQALHRARELFDEIRRKSAERSRPAAERDYYRRLIDRF